MNLKEIKNKIIKSRRIFDMSRVGFLTEFDYEVYIRTDDGGNIPHVHVWGRDTKGKKFSTCVKLTTPEYFHHGGRYKDVFNSKQKKAFVDFMSNKRPPRLVGDLPRTGYELCVALWNDNNSDKDIEIQYDKNNNPIIPDYSQL